MDPGQAMIPRSRAATVPGTTVADGAPRPAGRKIRRLLGGALRWTISLGLLGWILSISDPVRLLRVIREADLGLLVAGLLVLFTTRMVVAERWRILLKNANVSVRYATLFQLILKSMSISLVVPGGSATMDAYRIWALSKSYGRVSEILATVVVERALTVYSLLVIAAVVALAGGSGLPGGVDWPLVTTISLAFGTMALLFAGKFGHASASWIVGRWSWLARVGEPLARFGRALQLRQVFSAVGVWILGLSILVHVARTVTVWLIFESMTPAPSLGAFMLYVPLMYVALMLPISVGGLGVRESALLFFLGPHGVPTEVILAGGILYHAMGLALGVPGVFLWLVGRERAPDG